MLARSALLAAALCACATAPYKLSTWNLNWLTLRHAGDTALPTNVRARHPEDFARLRRYAEHLDADVVAFEEVDGVDAASRVFDPATYTLYTIDEDVVQRVGLAVRRGIVVQRHADVEALDVEPRSTHRLRAGLDATLVFPDGAALRVLVVHLKTGCQRDALASNGRRDCALLAAQVPVMAAWIRARARSGEAFAILGDFNREMDDPDAMQDALEAAAPLQRVTQGYSDPCWDGGAFIDHIFLGGGARNWLVAGSLRVMTYKTSAPTDRAHLSDHCPVSIQLKPN